MEHTGSVNKELVKTGGLASIVVVCPLSGCPLYTGIPLSGVSPGSADYRSTQRWREIQW